MKYTNNSIGYGDEYVQSFEDIVSIGNVSFYVKNGLSSGTYTYNYTIPEGAKITGMDLMGNVQVFNNTPRNNQAFSILNLNNKIEKNIINIESEPKQKLSVSYKEISDTQLQILITSTLQSKASSDLSNSLTGVTATIYFKVSTHDIIFTNTNISITKPVSFGGDVSIGGSLTIPSDKGLNVNKLTGSSINIESVKGGSVNISAIQGGAVNINAITGGSLKYKVSEIGEAATSLKKGHLYYVPTQTLPYGNTTIPGFILYYYDG